MGGHESPAPALGLVYDKRYVVQIDAAKKT